ncbi:hypothetical protein FACS18947_7030 [Bacteroidia bacterium]|nr:hypothetical protein FACS18947_7030 [Bacteroidia bacterium]
MLFSYIKFIPVSAYENPKVKGSNRNRLWILIFCMFAYMGIENGIAYFADTVFVRGLGAFSIGAYAISLFWASMAVSRFFFGKIKKIPRYAAPVTSFGVACLMVGIIFCKNGMLMLCLFAAGGLMCGCIWPGITSAAIALYPEASGTVMSYLMVGGGIGGALMPVALGAALVPWGISGSFIIIVVMAFAMGAFLWRYQTSRK